MALIKIAWIGRLTGPKGALAYRIATQIAPCFPRCRFTFIGGPAPPFDWNDVADNTVFTGQVRDVKPYMREHDLIIGSGRVALEAMRLGKPVIAVGERCYVGPIGVHNIDLACRTNFGDCDWHEGPDVAPLRDDIAAFLAGRYVVSARLYQSALQAYNPDLVYNQVMKVYAEGMLERYLHGYREIPVLMYHRVLKAPPAGSRFNIYILQTELDRQLASLRARGYQAVTFKELSQGVQVRRPVILSFDDGYEDNYENLLPVLQRHQAKAVIFALGDRRLADNAWDIALGEPSAPLMDDRQLKDCHAGGLVEIGCHGWQHRCLTELNQDALNREVVESKRALETIIEDEVVSFAYPYGAYGDREAAAVQAAGYRFGVGTVNGPLHMASDWYRIRRIQIFPSTGRWGFWKKTSGFYLRYCKWKGKDFRVVQGRDAGAGPA